MWEEIETSANISGRLAFKAGRMLSENPYGQVVSLSYIWQAGWYAAQEDAREEKTPLQKGIFKDPLANTEIFYRIGEGSFGVGLLGVVLATWGLFSFLKHVSATLADGRPFVYRLENGKILSIERSS